MKIKRNQLIDKLGQITARISPVEKLLLFDLAGEVPENGHILEIGSAYGASAACLWLGAKKGVTLTLVDNFVYKNFGQTSKELLLDNLKTVGCVPYVFGGDSLTVQIPDKHYYLVHIDGDHTAPYITSDLRRFGLGAEIIVCHDYAMQAKWPSVTEAVDYFVKTNPYDIDKVVDKYVVLRRK